MTTVIQSRQNDIDAVNGNGVRARSAVAASNRNVLRAKKSRNRYLRWQAVEIRNRESAREAVVAESGGVNGGGLSHS